jgi:hypothetical protein
MRAGERKSYYMSVRNNVPEEFRATPDTPGITAVPYSFFSSTTSLIFFSFLVLMAQEDLWTPQRI